MDPLKIRSAYLGSKEYMAPLKDEVGGIIDIKGQLILSSAFAVKTMWALNTPKVKMAIKLIALDLYLI